MIDWLIFQLFFLAAAADVDDGDFYCLIDFWLHITCVNKLKKFFFKGKCQQHTHTSKKK